MTFPKVLQDENLRFVLISANTKIPFEQEWVIKNNYKFNDPKLADHITKNKNFGVLCGTPLRNGQLVILDIDDLNILSDLAEILPETFTVETGSGKRHFYFVAPLGTPKIILTKDGHHYGEVQSTGAQCISAGSIHPITNQEYKILIDVPIANITTTKLDWLKLKYTSEKKTIIVESPNWDNYVSLDLSNKLPILTLIDVSQFKKHRDEYYGAHPIHGSDTGMNFFVNPSKNLWHCFRDSCGGDSLSYLAMKEGIIECGEKLRGKKFMDTLEVAKTKYNVLVTLDETAKLLGNRNIFKDEDIDPYDLKQYNTELEIVCDNKVEDLKIKEVEWLVQDLIPDKSLTMIGGKSASYKSTLLLHCAYSIATGSKVFGTMPTKQCRVLYLNEENTWNLFKPLLTKIRNGLMVAPSGELFFSTYQDLRLDRKEGVDKLKRVIEELKINVLVFDSLKRFIAFQENDADQVNAFYINILKPIMARYKLTIILLHHAKKDVQGAHDLDMLRGSSDFVNLCDCILFTRRMPGKTWFELKQIKNRAKLEVEKKKIMITDKDGGFYFTELSIGELKDGEWEKNDCANDLIKWIKQNPRAQYKSADLLEPVRMFGNNKSYEAINELVINNMLIKIVQGTYIKNETHEIWK